LRQDNADLRLRPIAYEFGLISSEQHERVIRKKEIIEKEVSRLKKIYKSIECKSLSLAQLLSRPEWTYGLALLAYGEQVIDFGQDINQQIELELKYAGYIERQKRDVMKLGSLEELKIPKSFKYEKVIGLRIEAKEKFSRFNPENLGQASRISGVSPADISILMIALQKRGQYV
jgi:tRNA uridine 5-carboxymethylaminomethyl modification enzyme